mmetsp:Transcript_108989/g.204465  ORF Transcript_108989/g.204465 Transcript_108989/m.204465 type:complete len:211 (+) Transcript_108989:1-633(+)
MVLLDADGNGDISVAELLEGLLELRVMTRDKHRVALLHAMDGIDVQDYKFTIIERSLAMTHASVDIAASLHRIEDMLLELGVIPPKSSNSERTKSARAQQSERPNSPDSRPGTPATPVGGVSQDSDLRMAGQASNGRDSGGESTANADNEGSKQVMRELRAFRQALLVQGNELEHQAASIHRMQEAVSRLREEQEEKARRQGRSAPAWSS